MRKAESYGAIAVLSTFVSESARRGFLMDIWEHILIDGEPATKRASSGTKYMRNTFVNALKIFRETRRLSLLPPIVTYYSDEESWEEEEQEEDEPDYQENDIYIDVVSELAEEEDRTRDFDDADAESNDWTNEAAAPQISFADLIKERNQQRILEKEMKKREKEQMRQKRLDDLNAKKQMRIRLNEERIAEKNRIMQEKMERRMMPLADRRKMQEMERASLKELLMKQFQDVIDAPASSFQVEFQDEFQDEISLSSEMEQDLNSVKIPKNRGPSIFQHEMNKQIFVGGFQFERNPKSRDVDLELAGRRMSYFLEMFRQFGGKIARHDLTPTCRHGHITFISKEEKLLVIFNLKSTSLFNLNLNLKFPSNEFSNSFTFIFT